MLTIDLTGVTAVVTGATSPLGLGIARAFADAGADVVVHRRRARPDDGLARSLPGPGRHTTVAAELTDPIAVDAMFEAVGRQARVGVVVNNAGAYPATSLEHMTLEEFRAVVAANLDTTFLCTRAAARHMSEHGGAIVNIASLSAHRPALDQSPYNASKAAVIAFTRSAAVELAPKHIRVNCVSPGLIHRDDLEQQWPDGVERWLTRAPLGRLGTPRDIANACVFLASPLAAWITGHDLIVDGGMSATPAY